MFQDGEVENQNQQEAPVTEAPTTTEVAPEVVAEVPSAEQQEAPAEVAPETGVAEVKCVACGVFYSKGDPNCPNCGQAQPR
jgi:hypothetical protein